MADPPPFRRLTWSELALLALLAAVFLLGVGVSSQTAAEAAVKVGALAAVLVLAQLWELTLRRARTAAPPTWRRKVWNAVVFVAWLAVMSLLVWWYSADREAPTRAPGQHEESGLIQLPEQPAAADVLPERPATRDRHREGPPDDPSTRRQPSRGSNLRP
jgi:hypothetical protein